MFNPQRGQTPIEIDGAAHRLCLTLGALAEIEGALGVDAPSGLAERMARLTVQDLQRLLTALMRAGGADEPERLAARADPRTAAKAVAACLKANLT